MLVWAVAVVVLVGAVTASASVGPLAIDAATVWRVIAFHALGVGDPVEWSRVASTVVWDLRLPR
jgi:ABC-type Fe3+-siderophore transport system permease subunit